MSSSGETLTRESVLRDLDTTWNDLLTYLASLSHDQLTRPTDAAGWTAKDHVAHIAAWEQAALAFLERRSRREAMDIPVDVWEGDDDDSRNAILQQRYRDLSAEQIMEMLRQNHERVAVKLASMTDEDLQRPASYYSTDTTDQRSMLIWLPWETYKHYRDHMTWIQEIVAKD